MGFGTFFFSSGGIGYHFRAVKYSEKLWDAFKANLGLWLRDWEQKNSSLLLIGPSAGYSLNENFLRRYKKVYINEPDILARMLFRRRFLNLNIENVHGEFIFSGKPFPDSDILFCNVLGQLRLGQESLAKLMVRLDSKNFASYHDLFSFRGSFQWLSERVYAGPKVNEAHLLSHFIQFTKERELIVEDHGLLNFFPSRSRLILHWEVVPGRHHLIECVSSNSFSFDKF
ncbi:MAG: hypothetical protein A4S09_07205 [Proteobacteria bacterium SG_bin7]|nr:MAG: hypothetical protein A4S09_07205 [Proteobacteria bacterium SG_bin7]